MFKSTRDGLSYEGKLYVLPFLWRKVRYSVVTRWRRMFSSTATQFNLMYGISASNLVESFWSSIIAGLLTVCDVTVFLLAGTLAPVSRMARGMQSASFSGFSRADNPTLPIKEPHYRVL
jgi:hypothetical protein